MSYSVFENIHTRHKTIDKKNTLFLYEFQRQTAVLKRGENLELSMLLNEMLDSFQQSAAPATVTWNSLTTGGLKHANKGLLL